MVRINANGEIVRDDSPANRPAQRINSLNRSAAPAQSPSHASGSSSNSSRGTGSDSNAAGPVARVTFPQLEPFERALGVTGQHVDLPPIAAIGWYKITQIDTVVIATLVAAAIVARLAGMGTGVILILLLLLAAQIHTVQTGGAPAAPARR